MSSGVPVHGGTDAGPEPRYDFSSNANPVGACPSVLAAVRAADVTRYPDPLYLDVRRKLAAYHGTSAERIVVGAGASELIVRLIRRTAGAVQQLGPTFCEYAHGARLCERRLHTARTPAAFLREQARHPGIGFICWPNNPTGELWPLEFVAAACDAGPVVIDLAYAALCGPDRSAKIAAAAAGGYRLYSPNKALGLTGIRAAYVVLPRADRRLAALAPSWVIGRDSEALLTAAIHPRALSWIGQTVPRFSRWRIGLAASLQHRGFQVRQSPATFLLARVGNAAGVAVGLRQRGIRVRDCTSFGLPEWIRVSAQPPLAQRALLSALGRAP